MFFAQSGAISTSWDDVARASFRECGPFSVKQITAEGVEAFDKLPVLHFSFGNKPDGTRAQSLRAFYRVKDYVPTAPAPASIMDLATFSGLEKKKKEKKKRQLEEQQSGQELSNITVNPRPRKKLTIKASKQQSMNDMLMGFYS